MTRTRAQAQNAIPADEDSAERAALSRLRMAANLSGGSTVREIGTQHQSGFRGWWFGLKLWRWRLSVADAVLSIRDAGAGVAGAVERFMRQADVDIARFAIVRSGREPSQIVEEAQASKDVWYFLGRQEHRDLLPLGSSIDVFLASMGRRVQRAVRQASARLTQAGVSFTFRERHGALQIDAGVVQLAERNRPSPSPVSDIAFLERMLAHRPNSFESRLTDFDGRLVSLCRGFVQGRTAYLFYQMNDPSVAKVNVGLFHNIKLIEELIALGATEMIFVAGPHQFKSACLASSKEELITIRPSLRGLAVASLVAVALRGTRFGDAVGQILVAVFRYWFGLPKAAYDHVVYSLTPPGKRWARAVGFFLGVAISLAAIGAGVLMREGLGALSYITAYPAFLVTTYLAGAWTGLLTVALGGIGILYFVIPPYDSFVLERSMDVWATVFYMASALPVWRWWARRTQLLQTA